MPSKVFILFLFLVAFLLRLIFVPNPGFEADVSFWKSWGLAAHDLGIVQGIIRTNNNYPTPFSYTLGFMVWIYSVFKDPHVFNEFWQNTNLAFLTISKLFPILADLGIGALILYIGKNAKRLNFPQLPVTSYQLLAFMYLLNPVSLIDGAWWGQVDSVGVFIFLCALLFALKKHAFLAGFIFMLAMMTKLQNMIYGPLFFLFIWQTLGFDGLVKATAGAITGFFGLNVEFFLSHNMDRVIASLTQNYDYFPWMSLNAFNLWWIVARAHGMQVTDKITVLGMTNAKTVGLLMFAGFYLFALLKQVFHYQKAGPSKIIQSFLENLIIINAAFFLFQTQSHDRYAFPLSVFLLLWAPFYLAESERAEKEISKKNNLEGQNFTLYAKRFALFYGLFSLVYFYNLHTALVFNYPHNGFPGLSLLIQPAATITVSVLLILLFMVYLCYLIRSSRSTFYSLLFALALAILGLLTMNSALFTKRPVSITKFTPIISRQDFGGRQTDRSVNSGFGTRSWNRLSVQYAFYKKGIGTHANSIHTYDINRNFTRLTTDYGMDTESGLKASAIFEIYGDQTLLYRSETMRRFDLPRHAEIDVSGIKHLTLVTKDAGDGNIDDHTDWLRPTLWP